MLLIPAIDLKDGRCVRLRQGRMDDETIFSDDPVELAGRWVREGARRLHLVDLNGAFAGKPVNDAAIRAIAAAYPELPLQVGGGIRDEVTIDAYLQAGVRYCIIGTQAVREPEFVARACRAFPGRILVGLDARDGWVAINGWSELTGYRVEDLARRFEDDGVVAIIYTDIGRDGMLSGPNITATRALAEAVRIPIIASGGITTLDDIRALCEAGGIEAAITGRAIYEGTLDFAAGQQLADALSAIQMPRTNDAWLEAIAWGPDGLIPAIAQEHGTGSVLMLAWMNREALRLTRETGYAVYWSRSRARLWRKGEESGHQQVVHAIRLDCDGDVILLEVEQKGGIACHTGRHNCFYRELDAAGNWIEIAPVLKDPNTIYSSAK